MKNNNMTVLQWLDGTQKYAYPLIGIVIILGIIHPLFIGLGADLMLLLIISSISIIVLGMVFISIFLTVGFQVLRKLNSSPTLAKARIRKISIMLMLSTVGIILAMVGMCSIGLAQRQIRNSPIEANVCYGLWTLGEMITSVAQILAFQPPASSSRRVAEGDSQEELAARERKSSVV